MHEPELRQRTEQPYVAIAARVNGEAEFRQAADRGFPALFGWLAEHDIAPAGPPFIRYREFDEDGQPIAIELAAPVGTAVAADGPVLADTLPAGRWATLLHVGPYNHATEPDLPAAHAALRQWMDEHGLPVPGECVEQYRLGPVEEADYSKWETELAYPTT
jgi:effector-binding domain-containing protein